MSFSRNPKQVTLTQLDYVVPMPRNKKVKREVKSEKVDVYKQSKHTEVEIVKVTPPGKRRKKKSSGTMKLGTIRLSEINMDQPLNLESSSEEEENAEESEDDEDDDDFEIVQPRVIMTMEDNLQAGKDTHVGMGMSTNHLVDPKYAGYYNGRTAYLMRCWVKKCTEFTRDLMVKAGKKFRKTRYETILHVLDNLVGPLEQQVREFDGMVIKVMTIEFIMGYFNFDRDIIQLLHYFSCSTTYKIRYLPITRNQDFDIETTFSCGKKWIFGN